MALLREQRNSELATRRYEQFDGPLAVSSLLLFEFEQSVRFQMFRHRQRRDDGIPEGEGVGVLLKLEEAIRSGGLRVAFVELSIVIERARELSEKHTLGAGHRAFDILHVATALTLGVREFLTFDINQRRLAEAEGLAVPL
jgi:predicted nucleic acid-binding protein